ncbi:hypothetical protein J4E83_000366 [Alternaria metachromatica]|uniref:uncharacterized protein n=1 Tax=Alternaria metachromatica TaxID=283354 RepID=UPI0020C2DBD4|nr:uncharacterized protein J4E83_000366 [Alternaria metachromatica]KAI4637549.1 hypothetical protein J4E83_000366 [Alternaria metachromatica]
MRRAQDYSDDGEDRTPPQKQESNPGVSGSFSRPKSASFAGNPSPDIMPSFDSMNAPIRSQQRPHSIILPSPSSFNFHISQSLPSISPPAMSQTLGPSTSLHDLQQQISLKTSELRTLQREYGTLLQSLERQKTTCATLERKLEINDGEVSNLMDEKDRLSAQVSTMEGQMEELQQSRDEARQQLIANGAQYMQIMDMANRLQAQSTEEKRAWEAEKAGLEQRILLLEEAMVAGTETSVPISDTEQQPGITTDPSPVDFTQSTSSSVSSQRETIIVLRAEISRLRARTQALEAAVQTMRRESLSIQEAARHILESSGKMDETSIGVEGGQR